jgi:ribosomal protein S18 acetylase RimI-like enzyme
MPQHSESPELPTGYLLRAPGSHDSGAVTDVVVAGDVAEYGEPNFTEDDLLDDWKRPRFELDSDAWVLTGPTGRVVGYAYIWEADVDRGFEADAFVVPEYHDRGLGNTLLDLIETRAFEVARGRPMTIGMYASTKNSAKRAVLERRGYTPTHSVLRLKIDLERRPPDEARPPAGIELRAYRDGDIEGVRGAMLDAFRGHHRYTPRRLDEWLELRLRHPAFDPALWRVAVADDEVVAAVLVYDVGGTGYMSSVGVRKEWRGIGVAQALVADAYAALRERGQMRVLVSLDAEGADAATRLFEESGMHVHEQHDWFSRDL